MFKSILKEISIILLLCIAIILILAILFYDYIPSNKVVTTKIAYTTPENVTEQIDEKLQNKLMKILLNTIKQKYLMK